MAIGNWLGLVLGLIVFSVPTFAGLEENPETVIFAGNTTFDRLVLVEARQQKRRILTLIPAGSFRSAFSLVIAQKNLKDKDQVHSGASDFLTALAEFSSPRLAVYSDKNPCIRDDSPKDAGESKKPTMSVAGLPYLKAGTGSDVKFEILNIKDRSWANGLKGLSPADKSALKVLASGGYGVVRVGFNPGKEKSKPAVLQKAVQIAWESETDRQSTVIHGKNAVLVERFFLGSESVERPTEGSATLFPTGVELPHEAAAVFPSVYQDWQSAVLAKNGMVRGYSGPVNRCDVCYERPPEGEQLRQAGVFWASTTPPDSASLRVKPVGVAVSETYLSRHLFKKNAGNPLVIGTTVEKASVNNGFVEQGSVQKPFLGEIFCPAMEGYQKLLTERREKTVAALNELSGWNEKKLTSVSTEAGVLRASWYQDHFQEKKP